MIEWSDTAILLGRRRHGETDVIVTALTREHGRHAGLVRGGVSRKQRGGLEPGTVVTANWRARLEDHLGSFTCEARHSVSPEIIADAGRLAGLVATCGLLEMVLPEREPHPDLYDLTADLLGRLAGDDWAACYADFERGVLEALGFGLHLDVCAATGTAEDLRYVSPKSGCAVSGAAGAAYADRLLRFPEIFRRTKPGSGADVVAGLDVTGYFLQRHVLEGKPFPEARARLIDRLSRRMNDGDAGV
jgi:DNA repair protein RecO (recombination protein O)